MPVTYDTTGRVAILTLNRPEARNANNQEMADAIEAAIDRFEEDDDAWIAVLAGNGLAFCAGADLKAVASGAAGLSTERGGFAGIVRRERAKPLIAAVEGPAVFAGRPSRTSKLRESISGSASKRLDKRVRKELKGLEETNKKPTKQTRKGLKILR